MENTTEFFEVHADPEEVARVLKMILDNFSMRVHRTQETDPRYILVAIDRLREEDE